MLLRAICACNDVERADTDVACRPVPGRLLHVELVHNCGVYSWAEAALCASDTAVAAICPADVMKMARAALADGPVKVSVQADDCSKVLLDVTGIAHKIPAMFCENEDILAACVRTLPANVGIMASFKETMHIAWRGGGYMWMEPRFMVAEDKVASVLGGPAVVACKRVWEAVSNCIEVTVSPVYLAGCYAAVLLHCGVDHALQFVQQQWWDIHHTPGLSALHIEVTECITRIVLDATTPPPWLSAVCRGAPAHAHARMTAIEHALLRAGPDTMRCVQKVVCATHTLVRSDEAYAECVQETIEWLGLDQQPTLPVTDSTRDVTRQAVAAMQTPTACIETEDTVHLLMPEDCIRTHLLCLFHDNGAAARGPASMRACWKRCFAT